MLRDLGLTSNQVFGLTKTDQEWSEKLEDTALTVACRGTGTGKEDMPKKIKVRAHTRKSGKQVPRPKSKGLLSRLLS